LADELFIIVAVFVEGDAKDKDEVYEYNYQATMIAIERAANREPKPIDILAAKSTAKHPFA
jgi:5,6,7,8-tetrahydromethanopterin hydro-lyase